VRAAAEAAVGTMRAHCLTAGIPPIKLLSNNVLLKLIKPERMTASKLLWIPENARRQDYELYRGIVVAVGPGAFTKKKEEFRCADQTGTYSQHRTLCDVKVGEEVMFYWGAGEVGRSRQSWPDSEHIIVPEDAIMCVMEP